MNQIASEPQHPKPAWRVVAISSATADRVRRERRSPKYGHPAISEVATGYGPCRHCLKTFTVGQDYRILFNHDSFDGFEPIPLPGPVFIHQDGCQRYGEHQGYPAELAEIAVVMNAYASGQQLLQTYVAAVEEDKTEAVNRLLQRPDVDYIEVRDRAAGCFDFRIEREPRKGAAC